jgi:hypothetical protein
MVRGLIPINTFKIMSRSGSSLSLAALLSVCATSLLLFSKPIASLAMPTSPNQMTLAAQESICSFITANNVNIRTGPGTQYGVVTRLNRGDIVRAVRRAGNWVLLSERVTSPPAQTPEVVTPLKGWVYNAYINGCSEDQFDRWRR